jgi:hypothetical protein
MITLDEEPLILSFSAIVAAPYQPDNFAPGRMVIINLRRNSDAYRSSH